MTALEIQLLHACKSALKLLEFCGLHVLHTGEPRAEAVILREAIKAAEDYLQTK